MKCLSCFYAFIVTGLTLSSPLLHANPYHSQFAPQQKSYKLIVHNRPLIKVCGTMISLHDVVQKLNVLIMNNNPDYLDNPEALFHIYQQHWQASLEELINAELMVAFWKDKKFVMNDTEVRASINDRFGPNVVENLNRVGLTYEQAFQAVEKDLMVYQLSWYFVKTKAEASVTPEKIKGAYQQYLAEFVPSEEWSYEIVTIRGDEPSFCKNVALKIKDSAEKTISLHSVSDLLEGVKNSFSTAEHAVTVSTQEYTHDKTTIPSNYKEALTKISVGSLSEPIVEGSAKKPVVKLLRLQKVEKEEPQPFDTLAEEFRVQMETTAHNEEMQHFITTLREQYGYTIPLSMLPSDYIPFELVEVAPSITLFNQPQKPNFMSTDAKRS